MIRPGDWSPRLRLLVRYFNTIHDYSFLLSATVFRFDDSLEVSVVCYFILDFLKFIFPFGSK